VSSRQSHRVYPTQSGGGPQSVRVNNNGINGDNNQQPSELVSAAIQQFLTRARREGATTGSAFLAQGDGVELLGALQPLLGSRLSGAAGDYAIGNLGTIIEQLVASDPGRVPTPASKRAIRSLKTTHIEQTHIDDGWSCAIQKEVFQVGEKATTLPCGHVFADHAILQWFKDHHSCPVCRHELPTEQNESNGVTRYPQA